MAISSINQNKLQINKEFIDEVLSFLKTKFCSHQKSSWVIYGSAATDTMNVKSDIDLFLIDERIKSPERISTFYKKIPITIYKLSKSDIVKDGRVKKYGGFFIMKLLGPYSIFSYDNIVIRNLIRKSLGEFLSPLVGVKITRTNNVNKENLAATSLLMYLEIFPHYDAYLLKLFISKKFNIIWKQISDEILLALLSAKAITKKGRNSYCFRKNKNIDFDKEKTKIVTRFWLYASMFHDGNVEFPDYYFRQSELFTKTRKMDILLLNNILHDKLVQL